MAEEKPNRLTDWLLIVREQAPVLRQQFLNWIEACKEEPYLVWETSAVRYGTYTLIAIVAIWVSSSATNMLSPPLPVDAQSLATTGDFHVICSDEGCAQHFIVHRSFGFKDFPVTCPKCQQLTGQSARRCSSDMCNGRWIAPIKVDDKSLCPYCQELFPNQ